MDIVWIMFGAFLVLLNVRDIGNRMPLTFRQLVGVNIGWVVFNLILLVISDKNYSQYFFPFGREGDVNTYDFSEFLVYVSIPLVLLYVNGVYDRSKK